MKNRIFIRFAACALLFSVLGTVRAGAEPSVAAESTILICADTGETLYEKNADARMLIASTTKIMTALVVIERCAPDEPVEISYDHAATEGSSMYLEPGVSYTVEDLLYGLMLVSGNDAAAALAEHTAGSIEAFAELMNEKARELGMGSSHFSNPHGLDNGEHYSTSRDMAKLMSAAMKNELFYKISCSKSYTVGNQTYINHNRLLWSCDGMAGGKTGYTKAAGRTLVTCAKRNGMTLVCVTLRDPDDWRDHAAMYDWGFENYALLHLSAGPCADVTVVAAEETVAGTELEHDLLALVPAESSFKIDTILPGFVFNGVEKGQKAGCVRILVDGEEVANAPLVYAHASYEDSAEPSPLEIAGKLWELVNHSGYRLGKE